MVDSFIWMGMVDHTIIMLRKKKRLRPRYGLLLLEECRKIQWREKNTCEGILTLAQVKKCSSLRKVNGMYWHVYRIDRAREAKHDKKVEDRKGRGPQRLNLLEKVNVLHHNQDQSQQNLHACCGLQNEVKRIVSIVYSRYGI